jgi:hypothetical protein
LYSSHHLLFSFVYPNDVVTKFGFDESVDLIQRLIKTGSTEFPHHLPFVEPSEVTASLSTGAFAVFFGGFLKDFERFLRLLNFREYSHRIGFLTQQDVAGMCSTDGH